jgi:hypothetical protein
MRRYFSLMFLCLATAAMAGDDPVKVPDLPMQYHFMEVHVVNGVTKQTMNEKFFIGELPIPGDVVEMVYTGNGPDGQMYLQLRTKPWWAFWR